MKHQLVFELKNWKLFTVYPWSSDNAYETNFIFFKILSD